MRIRRETLLSDVGRWLLIIVLIAGGLAMVFPMFWLVSTSLRPAPELLFVPPRLLPEQWTLENYETMFASAPMFTYLWNSLLFATVSTVFILLTSTVAGASSRSSGSGQQPPVHAGPGDRELCPSRSTWCRCSPR